MPHVCLGTVISEIVGIVGLVVSLAAIVVAVLIARRRPQLVFAQEGNVIVKGADPDIAISWRDVPVPNLSRTWITTWNAGAQTFDGAAVVPNYPLRYVFPQADRILAVTVLARSNEENAFDAKAAPLSDSTPNSVLVDLDYLDPGQGAVIEVLHTGSSWGARPAGTVKGLPNSLIERRASFLAGARWPLVGFSTVLLLSGAASIVKEGLSQDIPTIIFIPIIAIMTTWAFFVLRRSSPPTVLGVSTKLDTG